ncbi:hypothetical protein [Anaeromicropila herbilytica]|uniref:Uncharacterized protein n=1 Tax=Anaeromicropila herbilytica TaxID=2785025 RepID=A0A7R7IDT8_9FIRM|nr:hypothetical protein [Anaeromicropila herbilytica]BCN32058.1 hypothetical protein bsdtb5_33530 [Anaeromicropila herbilytica]
MTKQLRIGETKLTVTNVYPYRYDGGKGKQVLRIDIQESAHDFATIKSALANQTTTIGYYESENDTNFTLKNEYENYCLDFNCQYSNGIYSVEITRLSDTEQDIKALSSAVADLASAIGSEA